MNLLFLALLFLIYELGSSFVVRLNVQRYHGRDAVQTTLFLSVALEPEPEGGRQLTAKSSMPGCRMKEMEQMNHIKSDSPAFKFWMTGEVEGALIKEIRTQILKDASKKSNFPGFKKVCF